MNWKPHITFNSKTKLLIMAYLENSLSKLVIWMCIHYCSTWPLYISSIPRHLIQPCDTKRIHHRAWLRSIAKWSLILWHLTQLIKSIIILHKWMSNLLQIKRHQVNRRSWNTPSIPALEMRYDLINKLVIIKVKTQLEQISHHIGTKYIYKHHKFLMCRLSLVVLIYAMKYANPIIHNALIPLLHKAGFLLSLKRI